LADDIFEVVGTFGCKLPEGFLEDFLVGAPSGAEELDHVWVLSLEVVNDVPVLGNPLLAFVPLLHLLPEEVLCAVSVLLELLQVLIFPTLHMEHIPVDRFREQPVVPPSPNEDLSLHQSLNLLLSLILWLFVYLVFFFLQHEVIILLEVGMSLKQYILFLMGLLH